MFSILLLSPLSQSLLFRFSINVHFPLEEEGEDDDDDDEDECSQDDHRYIGAQLDPSIHLPLTSKGQMSTTMFYNDYYKKLDRFTNLKSLILSVKLASLSQLSS